MCENQKIDLSDLKVGDEVRSVLRGWGVIDSVKSGWDNNPIRVEFLHCSAVYTLEGKELKTDLYPEIVEVRKKKRMVTKSRTVWLNEYGKEAIYYESLSVYPNERQAQCGASSNATKIAVPYTMTWEEEE